MPYVILLYLIVNVFFINFFVSELYKNYEVAVQKKTVW